MKRHAQIGADILADGTSPLLKLAHVIAHTHHEKWDGSGYPRGLKGGEIPIVGRIIAISDVFDALTSSRPYKPAWAMTDAVQFMLDQSGTHFDPELVVLFHRELPEILRVRARCSSESEAPATTRAESYA